MAPEKLIYTVTEAAQMSGLSARSLWSALASGKLQAVRSTGRTLIPRGSLLRYLEIDGIGNPLTEFSTNVPTQ